MTASNYVHLDNCEILKETPMAFLIRLEDEEELWFPKSIVANSGDYSEGDSNLTISIAEWFASKEGII